MHVDGYRARALRAVEDHRHVQVRQRRGRDAAAHPAHVAARNRARAGGDLVGDPLQRHFAHAHPVQLARCDQRSQQARVLLVAGEDLVALAQIQPADRHGEALARARRQRHIARVAAQCGGVLATQLAGELAAPLEVRPRTPLLGGALQLGCGRLRCLGRERTVGAGIQLSERPQDRELGAQRG